MSDGYLSECFTCSKVGHCSQSDVTKILHGFTCPLFTPVSEPVLFARSSMMQMYGGVPAARALLGRNNHHQEEFYSMSFDLPPQGTTYSERKKQLEIMSFMDVRLLGTKRYKTADGTPILDWNETLRVDRKNESIEKVLAFELANNLILPDAAGAAPTNNQPTGVPQMANPPMPPFQPGMVPPQQPMPMQPPAPPQPPMMPQQQPGMPAAPQMAPPFGMAPQPPQPQGMPQPPMMAPPGAMPPPPATPQQAAGEAQPAQTGGKRKKSSAGAAAAPPPPPPATMAAPPPQQYAQQPQMPMPQQPQVPAQPWGPPAQQGFAPPPPQVQQQIPQQMPQQQAAAVDLTPLLAQIDAVGKAVNAVGEGTAKAVAELRNLQLVTLAALHHIYMGQSHLAQSLAGKDVGDLSKWIVYMQQYLPR